MIGQVGRMKGLESQCRIILGKKRGFRTCLEAPSKGGRPVTISKAKIPKAHTSTCADLRILSSQFAHTSSTCAVPVSLGRKRAGYPPTRWPSVDRSTAARLIIITISRHNNARSAAASSPKSQPELRRRRAEHIGSSESRITHLCIIARLRGRRRVGNLVWAAQHLQWLRLNV